MVKIAPSPTSAILTDGVSLIPHLVAFIWAAPQLPTAVNAPSRFIAHDSQAPPGWAAFRSPASLRAPPAFLA